MDKHVHCSLKVCGDIVVVVEVVVVALVVVFVVVDVAVVVVIVSVVLVAVEVVVLVDCCDGWVERSEVTKCSCLYALLPMVDSNYIANDPNYIVLIAIITH